MKTIMKKIMFYSLFLVLLSFSMESSQQFCFLDPPDIPIEIWSLQQPVIKPWKDLAENIAQMRDSSQENNSIDGQDFYNYIDIVVTLGEVISQNLEVLPSDVVISLPLTCSYNDIRTVKDCIKNIYQSTKDHYTQKTKQIIKQEAQKTVQEQRLRAQAEQRADAAEQRADTAEQRVAQERHLKEELNRRLFYAYEQIDEAEQRAEQAKQKIEQEIWFRQIAEQKAVQERRLKEQETRRADAAEQEAIQERRLKEQAEQENKRLRQEIERLRKNK